VHISRNSVLGGGFTGSHPVWFLPLIGFALLAVGGCGTGVVESERQQKAAIDALGGTVEVQDGHIVKVDLHDSKTQDADLANLKGLAKLESVDLRGTAVTDAGLELLQELPTLQYVDVSLTQVTEPGVAKLKQAIPNIAVSGPGV
jgi:hypothetical protein